MAAVWTRDELVAWVGGDVAALLDANAASLPVPDWLARSGSAARPHSSGQRLAAAHPDERQRMVDLWWEMTRHPGETFQLETVVKGENGWSRELLRYVNLVAQDDVGAVVVAVRFLGAAGGVELPEVIQSGEFEEVDLLIHELDETGVILRTEGKVLEITGRPPEQVVGQSVLDHLHPDGFDDALGIWMEVIGGPPGTTRTGRQRVLRPDGTTIWVEVTTTKRVSLDGTVTVTVICHDLTERRKQESALRTSQLEFRLLADQVPAAVFRADSEQLLTFRNERWAQLIEDGLPVRNLRDIVHQDDRSLFDQEMFRLVSGPSQRTATFEVRSRDGDRVYAISCQSVVDLVNERRSFVGGVADITSTVRLRERAERDALTGLRNRVAVEEHLQQVLSDESENTVIVVFVDLDGFKGVNDTFGHEGGDKVLIAIAERLQENVRPEDVVGRFGGDEFVMVVRHDDVEAASIVDRLQTALQVPIIWDGGSWQPSASIGTARPQRGEDLATVLRNADRDMFATKRQRKLRAI